MALPGHQQPNSRSHDSDVNKILTHIAIRRPERLSEHRSREEGEKNASCQRSQVALPARIALFQPTHLSRLARPCPASLQTGQALSKNG